MIKIFYFFLTFVVGLSLGGVPHQDRVHDQNLSDKEPGSPDYDHEAFLGKDEAAEFDNLSDEESRRRLGLIVDKIDKNGDGQVSEEELKQWIVFTQSRYLEEDSRKQFEHSNFDKDEKLTWNEYKKSTFGDSFKADHGDDYQKMQERDRKRFEAADADGDGALTLKEHNAFLHPEEHNHMKKIVAQEVMDEIDKNKDGFVDLEEYIGDMLHGKDDGEESDWVATEREQFREHRDTNKDGKLDKNEVQAWIMPDDYNHADAEAKHLIYEADDDKNGELSKEEILNHHDTFVGSQVTDWGEALKRHDEF